MQQAFSDPDFWQKDQQKLKKLGRQYKIKDLGGPEDSDVIMKKRIEMTLNKRLKGKRNMMVTTKKPKLSKQSS